MKISVHLEADSAEEVQAFFAAFQVKQPVEVAVTAAPVVSQQEPAKPEPVPAPTPTPEPAPAPEPEPEKPVEPPVAAARPRGRPRIVSPVEAPVEAPKPALKPKAAPIEVVSRQDLLDAFAEYVQRYSANFGYTDISNLLQQHLGDGVRKASDVPDSMLPVAISAIKAAITDNPFNRKRDYA